VHCLARHLQRVDRPPSAQRNVYLTGFCLFLSLVLARTFYIIQDLIHVQDEYAKLKTAVRSFSLTSFSETRDNRPIRPDREQLTK